MSDISTGPRDPLLYEDDLQPKVERLYLMQARPDTIAKSLGLSVLEVNARIRKVEDDMAEGMRMSSSHRILVLFGSLVARSRVRYGMLGLLHDSGVDQLGAIKAMKEEDKYVADLLMRPAEIAKALEGYRDDGDVRVHVLPEEVLESDSDCIWDDSDPDEEILSYNVIKKATEIGRGTSVS